MDHFLRVEDLGVLEAVPSLLFDLVLCQTDDALDWVVVRGIACVEDQFDLELLAELCH